MGLAWHQHGPAGQQPQANCSSRECLVMVLCSFLFLLRNSHSRTQQRYHQYHQYHQFSISFILLILLHINLIYLICNYCYKVSSLMILICFYTYNSGIINHFYLILWWYWWYRYRTLMILLLKTNRFCVSSWWYRYSVLAWRACRFFLLVLIWSSAVVWSNTNPTPAFYTVNA